MHQTRLMEGGRRRDWGGYEVREPGRINVDTTGSRERGSSNRWMESRSRKENPKVGAAVQVSFDQPLGAAVANICNADLFCHGGSERQSRSMSRSAK